MGYTEKVELTTVPEISVYIRFPFKRDNSSMICKKKLKYTVVKVYNVAKLLVIERTKPTQVRNLQS